MQGKGMEGERQGCRVRQGLEASRQTKMAYVGMQEGLGYASKQVKDSR